MAKKMEIIEAIPLFFWETSAIIRDSNFLNYTEFGFADVNCAMQIEKEKERKKKKKQEKREAIKKKESQWKAFQRQTTNRRASTWSSY